MANLQNKIDFCVLVKAENANPNGDPQGDNYPRITNMGYGEMSDVCIKRKIRNRLQDMGEKVFVQSEERQDDGFKSLKDRLDGTIEKEAKKERDKMTYAACKEWIDVRTFGQVFAFGKEKDGDVSGGVRGPVSIHQATSISPVEVKTMQITKSVNNTTGEKKGSDTMGTKYLVEFGLYKIKGAINVQLAEKTGFSEEDAEKIKEALRTLFVNDASSARPDGSMEVVKVYWWRHNNQIGQYSSAKVHDSLKVTLKEGIERPSSVADYNISLTEFADLKPEIIEGM